MSASRERFLIPAFLVIVMGCADRASKDTAAGLSEEELDIYAAAVRYTLSSPWNGLDGVTFLSFDERDPPVELLGRVFRPASRAEVVERQSDNDNENMPRLRVYDKRTGEPGSIIKVKILERLGDDRVKVECEKYTGPLWAGGCNIFLRKRDGEWVLDGIDEDSVWVS
jgi:hypothetical protein